VSITRKKLNILVLFLVYLCLCGVTAVSADLILAPDYLWDRHIAEKTDPIGIADTHLGIPYRDDGALDSRGYFTTFADPSMLLDTPGLNCSGLVVSVSRFLFNKNWTLEEVTRDRQSNSGKNSPLGKDWDFGWDLILNLTDGSQRRVIMPDQGEYPIESADGTTLRGFDLHDSTAWQRVLPQMRVGRVYLGSISRPARDQGYKLLHYHVVLMMPDPKGGVQLYHATRRSQVHRININSQQGLNRFMGQFRGASGDTKKILIVEAILPNLATGTEDVTDAKAESPVPPQKIAEDLKPVSPQTLTTMEQSTPGSVKSPTETSAPPQTVAQDNRAQGAMTPPSLGSTKPAGPDLVINHLSGKVFNSFPELVTHIPRFSDDRKNSLKFWFHNRTRTPRNLEIFLRGPSGEAHYRGQLPDATQDLSVIYPQDFAGPAQPAMKQGEYLSEVRVDGAQWCANLFEVAVPREAQPKILSVRAPASVQAGNNFTVAIEAKNLGAESDYGGITVSSPDPSGLKLVSAKPGRIYGPGSTVLSVTTDRIRTKVPMAERWIELWGENKAYDLQVQIQAGRPGIYPLYVRCAIRGVNVKSSVILMDPSGADTVDQQGFPVFVHQITVR